MSRFFLSLALAGLLLMLGAATAFSGEESALREAHREAVEPIVKTLEALWKDARAKGLEAKADRIAEMVIHFSSDHAECRAWLDQEKVEGGWSVSKYGTNHEDSGTERAQAAFKRRFDSKVAAEVRKLWKLYDRHGEAADEEDRNYLLADIFVLAPEDERVTKLRTTAPFKGLDGRVRWVTPDIPRMDRPWIRVYQAKNRMARELGRETKPVELPAVLREIEDIPWETSITLGSYPVWGTCNEQEAWETAHYCLCTAAAFREILGVDTQIPDGQGTVVLTEADYPLRLLKGLGYPTDKARYINRRGTFMFPEKPWIVTARWHGDIVRTDSACRWTAIGLFHDSFGCANRCAWAPQAVSAVLTYIVNGSRFTVLGMPVGGTSPLEGHLEGVLYTRGADWWSEAARLARQGQLPKLSDIAALSTDEIYVLELLAAYMYAHYILFVHTDKAHAIFSDIGEPGTSTRETIEKHLDTTTDEFETRFARWLQDGAKGPSHDYATKSAPR